MPASLKAAAAPQPISALPGPPGLPLLGNLLQLKSGALHHVVEGWQRRYGDRYRFGLGRRRFVVFSDPQAIAAILRDRPDGFQRSSRLTTVAQEMGFGGVFAAGGDDWRRQRPMVMASFDPAQTKAYFASLLRVTQRLARRWDLAAAGHQAIDLQADLMRYTVDVTAGLAFGADINTLESDGEVIQDHLDRVLPALFKRLLTPFPYWRYFKLPSDRKLEGHLDALRAAVAQFIAQARARLDAEPALREHPRNLIEAMIAASDQPGSGLGEADISGNVLTMLLAGEDTTANTLAWLIYLLHRNPSALQRATDEVRRVVGARGLVTHHDQLAELDYLDACANETMRLKPVAPLIMAEARRATVVAGTAIPAGTLVMCLMRPAAVDARHFADPLAFEPQRWLDAPDGAARSAKRAAMPFGAGPRLCPGRYLAMQEIKMAVAMLLGRYDIDSVTTPEGGEAQEWLDFTMAPVGLRLRLRARTS